MLYLWPLSNPTTAYPYAALGNPPSSSSPAPSLPPKPTPPPTPRLKFSNTVPGNRNPFTSPPPLLPPPTTRTETKVRDVPAESTSNSQQHPSAFFQSQSQPQSSSQPREQPQEQQPSTQRPDINVHLFHPINLDLWPMKWVNNLLVIMETFRNIPDQPLFAPEVEVKEMTDLRMLGPGLSEGIPDKDPEPYALWYLASACAQAWTRLAAPGNDDKGEAEEGGDDGDGEKKKKKTKKKKSSSWETDISVEELRKKTEELYREAKKGKFLFCLSVWR
ncbi:hypothetical protein B0T20DRAFT_421025 [Sordaria brevicollis]|uniref:Uncharacterized protein n=1 Tax=Sordaria brevicollis TaxID=83679 RepID=A0AAE0P301_SORBR|nr:hypothetical protein B0T20DRAFT_421025 [Sordaria brevicollis]